MRSCTIAVLVAACSHAPGASDVPADAADGGKLDGSSGSAQPPSSSCLSRWQDGSIASALGAPTLLGGVNTINGERYPVLSPDELTLYFDRADAHDAANHNYVATRAAVTDPFDAPVLFAAAETGTGTNPYKVSISTDGTTLAVSRFDGVATSIWTASSTGAGTWTPISRMYTMAIDSEDGGTFDFPLDVQLGSDGLSLVFTGIAGSNAPVLQYATRANVTSDFATEAIPGLASPPAGSAYFNPWLAPDQALIAFVLGPRFLMANSLDVVYAVRDGSNFGSAIALSSIDEPTSDDADPWISPDYCRVYFSSDRTGGASQGSYDLYVAAATPE